MLLDSIYYGRTPILKVYRNKKIIWSNYINSYDLNDLDSVINLFEAVIITPAAAERLLTKTCILATPRVVM
jgi:hypothetical protein